MESKYCYPGTKVLINNLDIHDSEELQRKERALVSLRIVELSDKPIKGSFDLKHLSKIHLHLFQDIYKWAGKTRTCILTKDQTEFCLPTCIVPYAETIFGSIKSDGYYISLSREEKIVKLAMLFADINALHPFREGNGRTQRIFIEWLATVAGISLDFTRVPREQMAAASMAGMRCDYEQLIDIFDSNSHSISEDVRRAKIKKLVAPKALLDELSVKTTK